MALVLLPGWGRMCRAVAVAVTARVAEKNMRSPMVLSRSRIGGGQHEQVARQRLWQVRCLAQIHMLLFQGSMLAAVAAVRRRSV